MIHLPYASVQTLFKAVINSMRPDRQSAAQGTHNVANLQKIMTRIGGVCLITIGVWCVIELGVQFGHYNHSCYLGTWGER